MLSRIMGVTTYATSTVLAAFMAGLGLGSFIFGRVIDKRKDPLRIYGWLQLLIAVIAIITPTLFKISLPLYKHVYEITGQNTTMIVIVRVFISFISILIPTTMMGGTLPILTSHMVRREGLFGRNFSLLYGLNTLGAVFGVILSGFITIGSLGEWNSILIGVLINFIIGVTALLIYEKELGYVEKTKIIRDKFIARPDIPISPYSDTIRKIILISFLMSGFTALAYEVIWSRQLILFLETSTYAFSGMLAVFLTGIGLGSVFMNRFVDKLKIPLGIFGILELIVGILSILNLYLFCPLDSQVMRTVFGLSSRLFATVILVFPLTFLFGAIFPIASLCYTKSINRSGFSVGTLYSFNAIGNIIGSLFAGFLFIRLLGSSKTVILLGFVNVAIGLILLWLEPNKSSGFKLKYLLVIPIVILLSLGFKDKDPFLDVIEKRISKGAKDYEIFYNRESIEGTVTSFAANNYKYLWINGVGQTKLCTETKLMAHLPIMLAKDPKELLAICFGMGTTVKSACIYDDLNITSVELAPEVYECFEFYHPDAKKLLSQKNVNLIVGDGRNFLLFSSKKYDVITVDPSPPIHSAGTVNLYTREFLSLCREHLTPDGVMCLWFPYGARDAGATDDDLSYILKSFYCVFPDMTVWIGPRGWGFYIIGTLKETSVDKSKIERYFKNPRFLKDLSEYDKSCPTSSQLTNLLVADKNDVGKFTKNALILTDNFPYTEFPLWRHLFP